MLRRGSDGAVRDTVLRLPAGAGVQFNGGRLTIKLFDAEPIWELAEDGRIFHGSSSEERIEVRALEGALERVVNKPALRQTISEGEREVYRNAIRKAFERQGMPPAAMQMVMQGLTFADQYPAFLNLLSGPEGSLWVQRVQTAEEMTAGGANFSIEDMGSGLNAPDWDVFDRDGRFLGTVTLPPRFRPSQFHGTRLYGVLKDDLDVSYAAALEVRGGFGSDR